MIEGKTSEGFSFSVDDDAADDMELLEDLTALDDGNYSVMPRVIVRFLGAEQKKAMYDFYRGENGRVSSKAIFKALGEIFTAASANKDIKN